MKHVKTNQNKKKGFIISWTTSSFCYSFLCDSVLKRENLNRKNNLSIINYRSYKHLEVWIHGTYIHFVRTNPLEVPLKRGRSLFILNLQKIVFCIINYFRIFYRCSSFLFLFYLAYECKTYVINENYKTIQKGIRTKNYMTVKEFVMLSNLFGDLL